MAPTHIVLSLGGVAFNLINGSLIGGWLGGYGSASSVPSWQLTAGSVLFGVGLFGNIYHEEILRNIRRNKSFNKDVEREGKVVVDNGRIYKIPEGGLFKWIWHPHVCSSFSELGYLLIQDSTSLSGLSGQDILLLAVALSTFTLRLCSLSTRLLRCSLGLSFLALYPDPASIDSLW